MRETNINNYVQTDYYTFPHQYNQTNIPHKGPYICGGGGGKVGGRSMLNTILC